MIKKLCAIYTRKSHTEGLDQDFNSLDAQREACEAFITSQRHEGWVCEKTSYDDAAYSGGTLNRPALTQLLSDIALGNVQVIVVYKVDRLTRCLADFAKLIELFDKHEVSFVSVTQQFNTTSSMDRLTLNVLLSFAQFEREITGERIRDKFAASKQKGMWMGGFAPLGYDSKERKLIINAEEAKIVRHIYGQYLKFKNVRLLKQHLDKVSIVSKRRINRKGDPTGGVPHSRGNLYKLLKNPIYRGMIRHKDKVYPGQHLAIIDDTTWNNVQALLAKNNDAAKHGLRAKHPSLLAGKLFDDKGNHMSPSHAVKNGKRYRYYTSQAVIQQKPEKVGTLSRVPAAEIESVVIEKVRTFLSNDLEVNNLVKCSIAETEAYITEAKALAAKLSIEQDILRKILNNITLSRSSITLYLSKTAIHNLLGIKLPQQEEILKLKEKVRLKRCQGEKKLILNSSVSEISNGVSPLLVNAIARAHVWNNLLMTKEITSVRRLAEQQGITSAYVRSIMPLANLAPDIIESILEGNQPTALTLKALCSLAPLKWTEQRTTLNIQFPR
jgi:site-specific DNA recombinase